MTTPKRVTLMANLSKDEAVQTARRVRRRLGDAGVEVRANPDVAEAVGVEAASGDRLRDVDLIVCLGGDGTLLDAVRTLGGDVPVLGINLGGLGFLTASPMTELDTAIASVLRGEYRVEDRPMLAATATGEDGETFRVRALNDIVLDECTFSRRAVVLRMEIDEAYVGTFTADGLIVATATGSTAYSLSAGGPIVHPGLPALVATPICAHSLSIRPLVFGQEERVRVVNVLEGVKLKITADGQDARALAPGTSVEIGMAGSAARLAFVGDRPYYEILRTKLNWGGIPKKR